MYFMSFEGRRLAASASVSPNLKKQALIVKRNGWTYSHDWGLWQETNLSKCGTIPLSTCCYCCFKDVLNSVFPAGSKHPSV